MEANSVLCDAQMIAAMQKLHAAMAQTCSCAGDVSLVEYAQLVGAAEHEFGLSFRKIQREFAGFENPLQYAGLLEGKELAVRVRDRDDRRGFALKATDKGRARAALIDESLASAFIAANPRVSEEAFEHLVVQFRSFSRSHDQRRRATAFFPGIVLSCVCAYHQVVVRESARLGMPSFHMTLLSFLDALDEIPTVERLARSLGVPADMLQLQLDHLRERNVVHGEDALELTEDGRRRVDRFFRKMAEGLTLLVEPLSEKDAALLEELGAYCTYLLAS